MIFFFLIRILERDDENHVAQIVIGSYVCEISSNSFCLLFAEQVNLSIAIIPMSHQFGWNSSVAGLVQSSFFWGYALSQLPGGWLAKTFGGRLDSYLAL